MDGSAMLGSSHTATGKVVSGHLHRDSDRVLASESLNSVMGEELQLKIAENARLHAALDGVDKRYFDVKHVLIYTLYDAVIQYIGQKPSYIYIN